jgi:hypothetical protein
MAASLASVPEVVKKNLSMPLGTTSSIFTDSLARTSHAYAGPMKASSRAWAQMASTTAWFWWPRLEHTSCADMSSQRLPDASQK